MTVSVPRILVVDGERVLAETVAAYMTQAGYESHIAGDGHAAIEAARELSPDVVILDLGLPGVDGIEMCRQIRTFSDCYVIMLTARTDEVDTLVGLAVGADGYVTNPFSARELVARTQVMLRRRRDGVLTGGRRTLTVGDLVIDTGAREVMLRGEVVEVTCTEFDVLEALASQPRTALSRRQLVEAVWGRDWVGDDHLVDAHIAHIRR